MVNFPTWIPDWDSHSPAHVNFVSGFRLELMYISPIVNITSGLTHLQISNIVNIRFSAACAAVIVHRNNFFCLYEQNKSSDSKVKFIQASNHCKRVLEAAN